MADLIVKSAVKEVLNDHNVSADFYEALDDEVTEVPECHRIVRTFLFQSCSGGKE